MIDEPGREASLPHAPLIPSLSLGSVDAVFERAVRGGVVAGVAAMAASTQGIVYQGAFGQRDLASGGVMTLDTVCWIASMTKTVTAVACMQLVEQGKLRLDQPMREVLPALAAPQVLEGFDHCGQPVLRPAKQDITLRHLLTHTAGYTYSIWSETLGRYQRVTGIPDIAESRNGAFSAPLEADPGERWQYGIGIDWVGKVIEAISGQSLDQYFRQNIFIPLGMSDTGFLLGNAQRGRMATLYCRQPDGSLSPIPFEFSQSPEFFMGGGGLFSTVQDYMVLLQMLLRQGTLQGVRILQPATVALMGQNHIGELCVPALRSAQPDYSCDVEFFPGIETKWGLSFAINTQAGAAGRGPGSLSWAGVLNCYFWIDPVRRVTASVFTQLLPFYDTSVVTMYSDFERELHAALARA
jgi:CubicO group peptidase (beta-lactamase class C family)